MIKSFAFNLKKLADEQGVFEGLASIYGEEDLTGDVVDKGAFDHTLQASGGERPLLWQHSTPIGLVELSDSPGGLVAKGKLSLGLQSARDAMVLMKDGVVKGLSIGFTTIRDEMAGNIRHLKEIKLWEVSLVTFPACEGAQVTAVKAAEQNQIHRALLGFRKDILAALEKR